MSRLFKRSNLIVGAALVGILLGGLGVYLHNRSRAIDVITLPPTKMMGQVTDTKGNPLTGTLTVIAPGSTSQYLTDSSGLFTIHDIRQPYSAQLGFLGNDGYVYYEDGELRYHTIQAGQNLLLTDWIKGDKVVSDPELADKTPPTITVGFGSTYTVEPIKLSFTATDNVATSTFPILSFYYRTTPTGAWQAAELSDGTDSKHPNTYLANIPSTGLHGVTTLDYFITARDSQGNQAWYPVKGNAAPNHVAISPGLVLDTATK
ncbi:MAG: hypothetical protein WCO52_00930 [bacterium]